MERANEKDHDFFYWRLICSTPYPITQLATDDKATTCHPEEEKTERKKKQIAILDVLASELQWLFSVYVFCKNFVDVNFIQFST